MNRLLRGLGIVVLVIGAPCSVVLVPGAWWAPFPLAFAVGLLAPRARISLPLGAAAGLSAWGVPLLVAQLRYGLGPAAASLSAILGLGRQGAYAVALTMMIGLLLGLAGAWLGSATRTVVAPAAFDLLKLRSE